MSKNSFLLELLVSGFFAIACLRARVAGGSSVAMNPRNLLRLTDRLERLRRTRWQWCSMVLVIVTVRMQAGLPLMVELTAALQFIVFLALPAGSKPSANSSRGRRMVVPRAGARQMGSVKAS